VEPVEAPVIEKLGSFGQMKSLIETYHDTRELYYQKQIRTTMDNTAEMSPAEAPAAEPQEASGAASPDYSTTNIQVAGVDEGDKIKTDGTHLYRIIQDHIAIVRVEPEAAMELAGRIELGDFFNPHELYLDNDKLVVIGNSRMIRPVKDPIIYDSVEAMEEAGFGVEGSAGTPSSELLQEIMDRAMIYPPYWWEPATTTVKVYDVADPANVTLLREVVVEGQMLSSRKIDDALYLVANRSFDYYWIMQEQSDQAEEMLRPVYRDSAVADGALQAIDYDAIGYFPGAVEPNYITLLGLSLDELTAPAEVEVFLGRGQNIYASRSNLYIALEKWDMPTEIWPMPRGGVTEETNTEIYRFALNAGNISYEASGKVPGRILNQFSMDEHADTFRIATTTGQMWRTDEQTSKNHLYILNMALERMGQIEDIAPTERIYSVRFMGNRAYMVTFRQIDPFYVIDLTDPAAPEILGFLKIPGYSDYLHPYDEDHIIGFGKEVYDVKGNAIPGGFKMAVFDVSNVANPVEKFKLEIGSTGTDSPLLFDHKALLFSKERNLIAFPITIMEKSAASSDPWQWGQFTFQGAHVYGLDLTHGFTLKSAITHISREEYLKSGNYWYDGDSNVDRILYVGDYLLTVSNNKLQRHDLNQFRMRDELRMMKEK
jgi:inhibitor of cysteine peptidase